MKRDKPNNIVPRLQSEIDAAVSLLSPAWGWIRPVKGYVVSSDRGKSYITQRSISVPEWAYDKGSDYFLYYVAHELAHILSCSVHHDYRFYKIFMEICPVEFQGHELGYKPSAKNYGIPPVKPGK